jgi:hypothetical protein
MSELTMCNYCRLKEIKKQAKKDKMKVVINHLVCGIDIYVVPKGIKIPTYFDRNFRVEYFKSWMMEISDSCVC